MRARGTAHLRGRTCWCVGLLKAAKIGRNTLNILALSPHDGAVVECLLMMSAVATILEVLIGECAPE